MLKSKAIRRAAAVLLALLICVAPYAMTNGSNDAVSLADGTMPAAIPSVQPLAEPTPTPTPSPTSWAFGSPTDAPDAKSGEEVESGEEASDSASATTQDGDVSAESTETLELGTDETQPETETGVEGDEAETGEPAEPERGDASGEEDLGDPGEPVPEDAEADVPAGEPGDPDGSEDDPEVDSDSNQGPSLEPETESGATANPSAEEGSEPTADEDVAVEGETGLDSVPDPTQNLSPDAVTPEGNDTSAPPSAVDVSPATESAPVPEAEEPEEEKTGRGDGSGLKVTSNKPKVGWSGVVPAADGGMPIPRMYQGNYKTVLCYYNGTARSVSTSGCSVVSISMVAAYLTGEKYSPEKMFSWALQNGLYAGNGLGQAEVSRVAANYGVSGRWIGRDGDAVIAALNAGKPVIAHMGPGMFTRRGHYIVLRGVTADGKILVNDCGSSYRSGLAFPMDTILKQTRNGTPFFVCG